MLSGVSIICFAASYAVALVLEVSRLLFRSGVRGAVMLGFAGAGLVAHSALLYYQAVDAAGLPLSSEQDWYLLAAWVLVVIYLYLVWYHPHSAFGLFLLPLVLGLIAVAVFFADQEPYAREPASKVWGIIHGVSILLGVVSVFLGFMAGLMYLGQARRLKLKLPPIRGLRLPSLEWLQRTNSRAIVVSVLMLGVGVISGIILNLISHHVQTGRVPWNDPVVLSTELLLAWLLIAVVIGALYRPARAGRKVAYLTVVSFVFLVIVLGAALFVDTRHGGARGEGPGGGGVRDTTFSGRRHGNLLPTVHRLPPTTYRLPLFKVAMNCHPLTAYRLPLFKVAMNCHPLTAYCLPLFKVAMNCHPLTAYCLPPTAYRSPLSHWEAADERAGRRL